MRGGDETGNAVVELAIVVPVLVLLMLFVVAGGRVTQARGDVYGAAGDAARAASLRGSPGAATAEATATARRSLADRGVTCAGLSVDVDTGALRPGGRVAVSVTCVVSLADLTGLGLPGSRAISASAAEVVDVFRGGP